MTTMWLIAKEGIKVPKEDAPRVYITDSLAVEVGMTPYYLRRLADADLREASDDEVAAAQQELAQLEAPGEEAQS